MHYDDEAYWRPLFENNMIPLQVTHGCSHNKCKFCDMYKHPYSISSHEEIISDIQEIAQLYPYLPRIFLVSGNAFALPYKNLNFILNTIRNEFSDHKPSVGCFARITDIANKSTSELAKLKELGLEDISIGAESGFDQALNRMNKGYTSSDIIEQCNRLDEVELSYNLFYLIGMGGKNNWYNSANATVQVFDQLRPKRIMIHTMTPFEGTPLWNEIHNGTFEPADEIEILKELRYFIAHLNINTFILGNHISNTTRITGMLPEQRKSMLEVLDLSINNSNENILRKYRASLKSI